VKIRHFRGTLFGPDLDMCARTHTAVCAFVKHDTDLASIDGDVELGLTQLRRNDEKLDEQLDLISKVSMLLLHIGYPCFARLVSSCPSERPCS